jgi:hypothetical protein
MDTSSLKTFAQQARRDLIKQVGDRLGAVLAPDSPERRHSAKAVEKLEAAIARMGREQTTEVAAYTWFNRFCARRFMDIQGCNSVRVVSPAEGQSQPEMLLEAKMGHIAQGIVPLEADRQRVFGLIDGQINSLDPDGPHEEAYRIMFVAACNRWRRHMPYLFEEIHGWVELLLPGGLLSPKSIVAKLKDALTKEDCRTVEAIGWLYQYYASEKKDQVFAALKKNTKISPQNIPAATQLFTPHWIVRYLVQNSLGRLWMQNRPSSRLKEKMEYYIPSDNGAAQAASEIV